MKKSERILRAFCNYIINNKVKINDLEEDETGQCVAEIKLSDVLKDTNIDYKKVTVEELGCLNLFQFGVHKNNNEELKYYGEICYTNVLVAYGDVIIQIWDGF